MRNGTLPTAFRALFMIVQAVFAIWLINGLATSSSASDDYTSYGLDSSTYESAYAAGTMLGITLILVIWAAVDLILLASILVVRLTRTEEEVPAE